MKQNFSSEDVINSLENIRRAEPQPFLFTRVQARLLREQSRPEIAIFRFVTRPIFAICFAVLFIFINGYLVNQKMKENSLADDIGQPIAVEYVQHTINPYEINENP
jgi:hypothetical protein